jgi:hypothetical protein
MAMNGAHGHRLLDSCSAGLSLDTGLGPGDVEVAAVIAALEAVGYRCWEVLEENISVRADPPIGVGPKADTVRSVACLRTLATGGGG